MVSVETTAAAGRSLRPFIQISHQHPPGHNGTGNCDTCPLICPAQGSQRPLSEEPPAKHVIEALRIAVKPEWISDEARPRAPQPYILAHRQTAQRIIAESR
jgi:hypothetical protein